MAIVPVAGPAGSGKSQLIASERRPGDILIDYTALWVALTGATRGEDGRYPVREDDDPSLPLVSAAYWWMLGEAVKRELSGFVTTASRANVERLEAVTGQPARIIEPEPGPLIARLTEVDGDGEHIQGQCVSAVRRWWTNAETIKWHTPGVGSWRGPDGKTHRVLSRPPRRRRRR